MNQAENRFGSVCLFILVFLAYHCISLRPPICSHCAPLWDIVHRLIVSYLTQVSDLDLAPDTDGKDAHTVYTNTRSCPPASPNFYFRVPLPAKFKDYWVPMTDFGGTPPQGSERGNYWPNSYPPNFGLWASLPKGSPTVRYINSGCCVKIFPKFQYCHHDFFALFYNLAPY